MLKRKSQTRNKFKSSRNCSTELRLYINKVLSASRHTHTTIIPGIKLPHHPATAVGGPVFPCKETSIEANLFKPTIKYLTSNNGNPKLRAHTLQQARVINLRPTWTLETIMASLMAYNGQMNAVRPGSEVDIPLFLEKITWQQLTGSIYTLYSEYRDYNKSYNHWTIYPCLMCDKTDPNIFKEIRRRVSKRSRIYIVEHAIRLRRVPTKFYSWVRREGAYILLQNYRPNTAADRIAQGLIPFLDEATTY